MNNNKQQSFTLIELLVVIVIIGILAGVIMISTSSSIDKASIAKSKVFEESVQNNLAANMVSAWDADHVTKGTTWVLNDKWGNNNGTFYDGTVTTCSTTACPQIVNDKTMGNVLSFDGVNDYVDFSFHPSLDLINIDEFSLSIWIKTPGTYLLSKGGSGTNGSYLIYYNSSSTFVFKGGPSTDTSLDIKANNIWQLLTITYDRNTNIIRAYNNGIISKEIVKNYPKSIYNTNIRIGTGDGAYFKGLLNDLRIYNAALSTSEIKQNYIAGLNSMLSNGNISNEEYNERINELAYDK